MQKITFILLYPFSIIYGCLTFIRNKLYDWNIFKSTTFELPIISIGNLSLGGTGKTPHTEYVIRLLQESYKISTLSRGYKRKTKGFYIAKKDTTVVEIGDEPLQYHLKFKKINVAVDENRVQYLTDTLPGSSGSPVFDRDWNVIALHHSGGWIAEPNAPSKSTFYRNEGINISKLIAELD